MQRTFLIGTDIFNKVPCCCWDHMGPHAQDPCCKRALSCRLWCPTLTNCSPLAAMDQFICGRARAFMVCWFTLFLGTYVSTTQLYTANPPLLSTPLPSSLQPTTPTHTITYIPISSPPHCKLPHLLCGPSTPFQRKSRMLQPLSD